MPSVKTEVTEITTGLGMLGYQDLDRSLEVRPRHITHVTEEVFDRLETARAAGTHDTLFETAWENGTVFARAERGLRGRPPWELEWKGHHKPSCRSIETIPADLRIDHVFLISCKYGSRVLHNSGPVQLFEHALRPTGPVPRVNWYDAIAPDAFRAVWEPVYRAAGLPAGVTPGTPPTSEEVKLIKATLAADPLDINADPYREFVAAVAANSVTRLEQQLRSPTDHADLAYRLLRMQAAPYFVLGAQADDTPIRYRVATPWDFNRHYTVNCIDLTAADKRQPTVNWTLNITDNDGGHHPIAGHIEIRWSHGKLIGSPEAKIYLDTNPRHVPAYEPL